MQNATMLVYASGQQYRSIGEIVGGLVCLKTMSEELFVILPGESVRARSSEVRVSDTGIVVQGRDMIPFEGTTSWERHHGNACVNFTLAGGDEGIIAPAVRPVGMDVAGEVSSFFRNASQDDDIFLMDLGSYIADGTECPDHKMAVLRSAADKEVYDDEDVLIVNGNRIPLADITWAEMDKDGDGNRHLHLVLADGRYRRVSAGDFSR